jgi:TRAP-type C4-dicarboxylate transport system substrate-binding protein
MSAGTSRSLSRRNFLGWTAATSLGAASGRGGAAQAQTQSGVRGRAGKVATLKLGSSQPTYTENAHSVFFDTFVSELAGATNGDIGAVFYGDSQLGPEDKYPTAIAFGTLDMMLTVSNWTTSVPELGVLTMGFLFDSMVQQGRILDRNAGQQLQELFKTKTKAEILGWCFNFGGRNVLSKAPVTALAEFRGKKLRVLPSPTFVQTFRLLGATPVPMSFSEIYTSLQTGVIDGLEHDPPALGVGQAIPVAPARPAVPGAPGAKRPASRPRRQRRPAWAFRPWSSAAPSFAGVPSAAPAHVLTSQSRLGKPASDVVKWAPTLC